MKRVWSTLGYLVLIGVVAAWAQETRKAGLWEISVSTKIQQPGETPGNFVSRGVDSAAESSLVGPPVCLTQEMVDKYGVVLPPSLKDCTLSNVHRTANSFKADMTCKGGYNGFGSVESIWTDAEHVTGKVRFVSKSHGTDSSQARSLTWSQHVTAVFKNSDCGAVKPRKMPSLTSDSK